MDNHEEGYEPTGEHRPWSSAATSGGWNQPPDGPPPWGPPWPAPPQQGTGGWGASPEPGYGVNPGPGPGANPGPDSGANYGPNSWPAYGATSGPGFAAHPGYGWSPPTGSFLPPASPSRGRVPAALTALLMVAAAAVGVGVGHLAWRSSGSSSRYSSALGHHTSPFGSGGSTGQSGNGGLFGGSGYGSSGTGSGTLGSGAPSDVKAIAAKIDPALVDINCTFSYQSAAGAGTGIVVTSNGEVITNNHVIDGATTISVTDVGNHHTYGATVVGYDATHDIAVLQLHGASNLTTAKLANSSKLAVGQPVVAVGNAGGLGGTPTSAGGSIAGLDQSITASDELNGNDEQLSGLILVTAEVQPGDSGGSLVNAGGQVIGMDTAASSSFSFQSQSQGGEGYAIPVNQVLATAQSIESGRTTGTIHVGPTAFLGVLTTTVNQGTAGGSTQSGAAITQVITGEPAEQIGLVAGDVITSFNGHAVTSPSSLSKLILQLRPGDRASIAWVDATGRSHSATVKLGSGPAD